MYKIIDGGASKNAEIWHQGNYSKILFPNATLESQRISELLVKLGNENVQRKFFKRYIKEVAEVSGDIVIDSTGMENEIDIPLTEYSGRTGDMGNKTKLIIWLLIGRLIFRCILDWWPVTLSTCQHLQQPFH